MKKKILLCFIIIVVIIVLLLASQAVYWKYQLSWKKTTISTVTNEENGYSVTLQEVGQAFTFGPSDVRVILKNEKEKSIAKIDDIIHNDGKRLTDKNISVIWDDSAVTIILSGEEQKDKHHIIEY